MARKPTINDDDREEWVNNDEGLYDLWLASKQAIGAFVRENRAFIDEVIRKVTGNEKPAHYLKYGG